MAGFFVVMFFFLAMAVVCFGSVYLIYSHIIESIFRMRTCGVSPWQAWLPFYGQVLLGEMVGMKKEGILTAVCHVAAIFLAVWLLYDPVTIVWYGLLLVLLVGFIFKSVIASGIFRLWAGERAKAYNVWSIVTLGALRPIFLFVLRKKVCMFSKNT